MKFIKKVDYMEDSLENLLMRERDLYQDSIRFVGDFWDHVWIPAYDNDDRGYEHASTLLNYFSQPSDNEGELGIFERVHQITSSSIQDIPAMEKELRVMRKLSEEYIKPTRDIILNNVLAEVEAREGKLILFPEEFAVISDNLSYIRTYFDYRSGYNYLRRELILKKKSIKKIIEERLPLLLAYERKWDYTFFPGGVEKYGFINFCAVDAHDNTILTEALETPNPERIVLEKIPEQGIDATIFNPMKDKNKNEIRRILELREQQHKMCNVKLTRQKYSREKIKAFNEKLKNLIKYRERDTNYHL